MDRKLTVHAEMHLQILESDEGDCEICGATFTELISQDNFADITPGSHATAEETSPAQHNAIKILEG